MDYKRLIKVVGLWLVLLVALFATIGIGAFRERFNMVVVTESEYHNMIRHASMEADAEYYAQLQRNLME